MNKFYKKYRIAGNWINIMLLLTVLVPLVALSYYNHPSPADDYCFIDTVFKVGWVGGMKAYYLGWTGRYFGIFLNHSNPLLFHSVTGFKVLPVVLLAAFVFALYSLFRHLTPTLSRMAHLGFAGVVFFLFVLQMASVVEAFYWMAAFVTYTVPNILTLFWVVLVLRWYRQDNQSARILPGLLSLLLIFCAIGCSETNLLVVILLLGGWCSYRLIFHRKMDVLMAASVVVAAMSCYFLFASPGNSIRLGGNPMSKDLVFSATSSFKMLLKLTYGWIIRTPLILFSFAWLFVLSRLSEGARNYFAVPVWFAFLLFIGVLASQLFPSYYGVGIDPTPRVINCVYLYFLIGWFYLIGVVFHYVVKGGTSRFDLSMVRYGIFYTFLSLAIVFTFVRSKNVRMIYTDLLKGKAAAYDKEVFERYALVKNSKEAVVYLPALVNLPESIFVLNEDIKTNPQHWWNKCMAGYFGKEAIYMTEKRSEQK